MGILKNLIISATGDCGHENASLKRWVEANGGKWIPRVQNGLTHLICSKEHFKKGAEAVKQAQDLNAFIVSYDWLEDSLHKKRRLAERKYTWDVLRTQRRKQKQIKRLGIIADTAKFKNGCEMAAQDLGTGASRSAPDPPRSRTSRSMFFVPALEELKQRREARAAAAAEEEEAARKMAEKAVAPTEVSTTATAAPLEPQATILNESKRASPPANSNDTTTVTSVALSSQANEPSSDEPKEPLPAKTSRLTDLFHIWLDDTGFEYKIMLVRANLYLNNHAKYLLRLYESHTKPHTYCTFVQYTPAPNISTNNQLPHTTNTQLTQTSDQSESQPLTTQQPQASTHAEATRLKSLISTPPPTASSPYRTLLCPQNSTFATAFQAFRHAFRDITLLPWESRFDDAERTYQKALARHHGMEPFVWSKPEKGLPMGCMMDSAVHQSPGFSSSQDDSDGYVRNAFNLPNIDVPLGRECVIGSAIRREDEEKRRRDEEAARRAAVAEEEEAAEGRKGKAKGGRNANRGRGLGTSAGVRKNTYASRSQSTQILTSGRNSSGSADSGVSFTRFKGGAKTKGNRGWVKGWGGFGYDE